MSSSPPVILPVPSVAKLPPVSTAPYRLKPRSRNAYCPVSSDSLPEPALQAKPPVEVVSVTVALADSAESSTDAAVTVTAGKTVALAGAVKVAGAPLAVDDVMLPQPGEQGAPFCVKVQLTPLLVPSLATVAVNGWVAFNATLAEADDTDTEMGATSMEVLLLTMLSVTEIATNDTRTMFWQDPGQRGGVADAVYVTGEPLAVLAGETVPHELSQEEVVGRHPFEKIRLQ
jgi:hypothetical protein